MRRTQPGLQPSAPKQVEKGLAVRRLPVSRGQQGTSPIARVQATDQQRREVHRSLFRERRVQRLPRSQLNVALAIGSRIPRRHRLYRFTPALLALVPMYAAYSYLVVDDTICVVDPETYAIVDMIPASIEQAGPPSSSARRARPFRRADAVRLCQRAQGSRAGRTFASALLSAQKFREAWSYSPFPTKPWPVLQSLQTMRISSSQDDVVIVNPTDYAIVQVISD